jgi:hypothetical protein
LTEPKSNTSAGSSDLSKDEINLLRTLKELTLPASRLTKLLSPKEETPPPKEQSDFDLVEVYHRAYSKALAIALERQALRDAGLLTQEQERPRNNEIQTQDGMQALLQFLKERPRDEKLTVSDLTMLILASNLGGNKADNAISLKDLLPLLSKRELTVADVMAILDKTRPPPPPAPMPQSSGGLNDLLDESVKSVLREKIVKALTEESKKGPATDWGAVANHVIEAIRGLTSRIPPPEAPPPETISGPPVPPSESLAPSAEAASESAPPSEVGTTTPLTSTTQAIPRGESEPFEGSGQ